MMNSSDIFNISKDKLLSIFSDIASEALDDFQVRYDHVKSSKNGIMGKFLIPTVTCQTKSGDTTEFTLFVRRRKKSDPGRLQAHHYDFLKGYGIPVPCLYGVLRDEQGSEVVFLEHLEEITSTENRLFDNPDTLKEFVKLMARFNSIRPTVDYAARLGWDMAERDFTMNWKTWMTWSVFVLDYIEKNAAQDLFDERIKQFCQSGSPGISELKNIALELVYIIPSLPVGYIHGDFLPANTGWRKDPRELVVFDFEDVLLDTRFYDIAYFIGGWDIEGKHPPTQRELAEIYLENYVRHGGDKVNIEDFIREITLVWYARKLNLWEYLPEDMLGAPSYKSGMPGETREERLDLVYNNLLILTDTLDTIYSMLG
jgi:thiamine kinase-like enzyme